MSPEAKRKMSQDEEEEEDQHPSADEGSNAGSACSEDHRSDDDEDVSLSTLSLSQHPRASPPSKATTAGTSHWRR